jgi:uncharacterized protein
MDPTKAFTRADRITGRPEMPEPRPADAPLSFHVLSKPTGAVCNLDCTYCFFLSKESLYPGSPFRMSEDVLETYIRQMIESQAGPQVTIAWQGGEPTMIGLEFFRRAMEIVKANLRPGMSAEHTIQTNGTLLDDEWCAFFREEGFLVGISMDGPREMHDAFRVDKGGKGSFDRVMAGARLMQQRGVEFNVLCTVHAANADHPLEVYRFFRDDLGARYLQFIPIVERATAETLASANEGWGTTRARDRPLYRVQGSLVTERTVGSEQWGRFLTGIFDEWVTRDVGTVFVQMFDAALASWLGIAPAMCIFAETCGDALALEHTGDLYSCDHFVEPDYLLGNIGEKHMLELVASPQQRKFGADKRDTLPAYCRSCDVKFACNGECPRNRFIETPEGEPGLNYLCAGYKAFFTHIDHPMRVMAGLLRGRRYADEAMEILAAERRNAQSPSSGRPAAS